MTLKELAHMCGGRLVSGDADLMARGVSIDSRTIEDGDIFLALKGENFDGHDFAESALEKGAAGVVGRGSRLAPLTAQANRHAGLIAVDDPLEALHRLAAGYRLRFDIPVVVVTGSCGKTTTKDMLAAILSRTRKTVATQENLNNLIGAPLMLLRITAHTEAAVIEIASNAPGEIGRLARVISPTAGIITNVGPVHLEGLESLEGVYREKTSVVPHIRTDGFLVVCEEDIPAARMRSVFEGTIITFGIEESADFSATDIRQDVECGTEFLLNGAERIAIPILGRHNVLNALAAAAAASQLGVDMDSIRRGLGGLVPSSMRMDVCACRGATILNDAYNANPRAMRESLSTALAIPARRRIFALGDMLELGAHAQDAHYALGQHIGRINPELLYLVGDLSQYVKQGALDAGMQAERIFHCESTDEIATSLRYILTDGDVLLVKGSRGMHLEMVVQRLLEED